MRLHDYISFVKQELKKEQTLLIKYSLYMRACDKVYKLNLANYGKTEVMSPINYTIHL